MSEISVVLQKVPTGARCQEASMLSKETYIPCLALASLIIFHAKDNRSYFMCDPCADHNLKHRGGRLATEADPAPRPIMEEPLPPTVVTVTEITQSELRKYIKLSNQLEKLEADLETQKANLIELLGAGAKVENGTHVAELKINFRKNVKWRPEAEALADRLEGKGKGKEWADGLLNAAEPSKIIQLDVH